MPEAWLRYFRPTGWSIVNPESSAKMLDEMSGELKPATSRTVSNKKGVTNFGAGNNLEIYPDKGGASRFFKVIK